MHHQQPTTIEKLAIEARLNMLLGAQVYDSLFLGFECGDIIDGIVHAYARTEYFAARIAAVYEQQVAFAVESVMKQRLKGVNIIPQDFADNPPLR